METNGGNKDGNRRQEQRGLELLPAPIREYIINAPLNLGAWGIYQHVRRLRIEEDWEIKAYVLDLDAKVRNIMHSTGHEDGTQTMWDKDHPQVSREYPWPDYQLKPRRKRNTRVTEVEHVEENWERS